MAAPKPWLALTWGVVLQELTNSDIGLAAQSLLNSALVDDTLDDGYVRMVVHYPRCFADLRQILCISIYLESSTGKEVPFGKRATLYTGTANLEEILQVELTGKHIRRVQETQERGKMLVIGKTPHITIDNAYTT